MHFNNWTWVQTSKTKQLIETYKKQEPAWFRCPFRYFLHIFLPYLYKTLLLYNQAVTISL